VFYNTRSNDFYLPWLRLEGGSQHPVAETASLFHGHMQIATCLHPLLSFIPYYVAGNILPVLADKYSS
jgi:hypothetical protein